MSFKAEFRTKSDTTYASNALRFATEPEAQAYAKDLYSRWFAAESFKIVSSDDPINYVWDERKGAVRIEG